MIELWLHTAVIAVAMFAATDLTMRYVQLVWEVDDAATRELKVTLALFALALVLYKLFVLSPAIQPA